MLEGIHDAEDSDISESIVRKYFENASVELKIQECPKLLYKGPMINTITIIFCPVYLVKSNFQSS